MPERQTPQSVRSSKPDAFFEAVRTTRIRGELVTTTALSAGENMVYEPAAAYFHYMEGSACTLQITGTRRKLELSDGDLVFMPRGEAHHIECLEGQAAASNLTTGVFRIESAYADAISRALPQYLRVPQLNHSIASSPQTAQQWLVVTLSAMRVETDYPTLGSGLMLSRLIDLLFVWAVRHWLSSAPAQPRGWIAALQDPMVGEALALLHAEPARDWNVNELARHLNQSRSGFSQRFVDLVGEPPIRYLARWRIHMAADLLTSTSLRISQIAQRVGYNSEPVFSRAFKRQFGAAPVEYRVASRRGSRLLMSQ